MALGGWGANASFDYVSIRPDGSSNSLVVKRNGNVGIGTTTPGSLFEVNGGYASVVNSADNSLILSYTYSGTGSHASHFIGLRARGTKTSPTHPLTDDGLATFQGRNAAAANSWSGMTIFAAENHTAAAQGTYIRFFTVPNGTTTSTDRMAITSTGNVGIGTITPSSLLDVYDPSSTAKHVTLGGSSIGPTLGFNAFHDGTNWDTNGSSWDGAYLTTNNSNTDASTNLQIGFVDQTTAVNNTVMLLQKDGNVGIGTTSPTTTLNVKGGIHLDGITLLGRGKASYDTEGYEVMIKPASGIPPFKVETFGVDNVFVIESTSNVGIGISTPSEKLDVVGNFELNGDFNGSGTQNYSSDKRFKKDIKPLVSSLEKIKKVNGYSYLMRTDEKLFEDYNFDSAVRYGVIAQEIKEVFPELVKTDHKGYYSVNYDGLIPVLLEAIKEQQTIITDLKNENSEINSEINSIKTYLGIEAKH